jgi:hypothetical protein
MRGDERPLLETLGICFGFMIILSALMIFVLKHSDRIWKFVETF